MFVLDDRLKADTVQITKWSLCRVLLMNDRQYPWLILVPEIPDMKEIIDLTEADRQTLMAEISKASKALKDLYGPDKINVAALGNMVLQLHIHVLARFVDDAAWPGPVWGVKKTLPYDHEALNDLIAKLQKALG